MGHSPWGHKKSDTTEQLSIYRYIHHIFFTHSSSTDGYLGYFHILDIVNISTMNIGVHVSFLNTETAEDISIWFIY